MTWWKCLCPSGGTYDKLRVLLASWGYDYICLCGGAFGLVEALRAWRGCLLPTRGAFAPMDVFYPLLEVAPGLVEQLQV